jgi:hypothetical protein
VECANKCILADTRALFRQVSLRTPPPRVCICAYNVCVLHARTCSTTRACLVTQLDCARQGWQYAHTHWSEGGQTVTCTVLPRTPRRSVQCILARRPPCPRSASGPFLRNIPRVSSNPARSVWRRQTCTPSPCTPHESGHVRMCARVSLSYVCVKCLVQVSDVSAYSVKTLLCLR